MAATVTRPYIPPTRWLALGVLSPSVLWVSVCRKGELGMIFVFWELLIWRKGDDGAISATGAFAGDEA